MDEADTLSEIRAFLQERLRLKGSSTELGDNDSLFVSGRLDSLDALETVLFLENRFGTNLASIGLGAAVIDTPLLILKVVEG